MAYNINKIVNCPSLEEWERCFIDSPPSLNTLRHAFTALLKWAFASETNLDGFAEELGCLIYSTDETKTQIHITTSTEHDPGSTEHVPGITIGCEQGVQYSKEWLSTESGNSPDFASHERVWLANAKIKIDCENYNADTACYMSDYVVMFLAAMEPVFRETFNWILDYKLVSQSEPKLTQKTQTEDATKWYESTIILDLNYRYSVFVARETKRLKDYGLYIDSKPREITLDS